MNVKKIIIWLTLLALAIGALGCGTKPEEVIVDVKSSGLVEVYKDIEDVTYYDENEKAEEVYMSGLIINGKNYEWAVFDGDNGLRPSIWDLDMEFYKEVQAGKKGIYFGDELGYEYTVVMDPPLVSYGGRFNVGAERYLDKDEAIELAEFLRKKFPNYADYSKKHGLTVIISEAYVAQNDFAIIFDANGIEDINEFH